jgi:molybdopterin converting factor small subunit
MAILIPHHELGKRIGQSIEIEADTVGELIRRGIARYGADFERATREAAIVVNGRSINCLQGKRTPLGKGDVVWLLLPAGGG